MSNPRILSIDAGTSSVRCLAVDEEGNVGAIAQREFKQFYPRPGWVEHDADEIWDRVLDTIKEVLEAPSVDRSAICGVGITNQRETIVAWDKSTGAPLHRAIVWQDRRTTPRCNELRAAGAEAEIREITGLVCDPYFSATKIEWLLNEGGIDINAALAFGTIDSWLAYKLSGGAAHITDASNASRYLLYDLANYEWSDTQLDRFGIPRSSLPTVIDSSTTVATCDPAAAAGLDVPIAGLVGDQQSALFGQACFEPGMTKNTYGTGSFVLVNAGAAPPPVSESVLSTVAWCLDGVTTYALEGSIFITGAAIKWLRDRAGMIDEAAEIGPLAESVDDARGVVVVPAFQGLGAPYWNANARGAILGLSNGGELAHIARAVVEAMAYQTRDVLNAMETILDYTPTEMRVDGGASVMDFLCSFQADQLGIDVVRPSNLEATAMGAAYLAGLATGVWSSLDEISSIWAEEHRFVPTRRAPGDESYVRWRKAVERVIDYAAEAD